MAGQYEAWLASPGLGPNWMHGPVGNAYWATVGMILDLQNQRLKDGQQARFPGRALAAGMSDALDRTGDDRLIPRGGVAPAGADESDEDYSSRLLDAWTIWENAGTPFGLLTALRDAGFPVGETGATIANHIGKYYQLIDGDLSIGDCAACMNRTNLLGVIPSPELLGFTLDWRDQFFSRFVLMFLADVPTLLNDDGNTVKAALNQTVQRWRCGGAIYEGCSIVESGTPLWGWPPTSLWGDDASLWGSGSMRFIETE